MSIGTFISKIWQSVKHIFDGLEKEVKVLLPIATDVVEKIKAFEDAGGGDIVTALIPGTVDDAINAKLKTFLPKLILELNLATSISNITDVNAQLSAILNALKLSSDDTKNAHYHSLGALILQKLADGKLAWSECVTIIEYYYQNFVKKPDVVNNNDAATGN